MLVTGLSALERRWAAVQDAAPDGTVQLDLAEWAELTGEEQEQAVGADARSVLGGEAVRLAWESIVTV